MNRNMVVAEWSRAREALRAAEPLTRERCYADAISRAYYAILHASKAALHVHDVAAESHAAVRRMFGLHLVRSGEIEPEWSAYLVESLDDPSSTNNAVHAEETPCFDDTRFWRTTMLRPLSQGTRAADEAKVRGEIGVRAVFHSASLGLRQ